MLVSFCAVIGIGAIREYQEINSNEPQAGNKIRPMGQNGCFSARKTPIRLPIGHFGC